MLIFLSSCFVFFHPIPPKSKFRVTCRVPSNNSLSKLFCPMWLNLSLSSPDTSLLTQGKELIMFLFSELEHQVPSEIRYERQTFRLEGVNEVPVLCFFWKRLNTRNTLWLSWQLWIMVCEDSQLGGVHVGGWEPLPDWGHEGLGGHQALTLHWPPIPESNQHGEPTV